MLELFYSAPQIVCYANDNDAYVPELWAMEALMILEESMVMSRLVHRDFSDEIRNFGDVVNTRRPSKFASKRKTDADAVVAQDANSTNVQVPLDQWHYNTFFIKDGENSKSFQDLVSIYLKPAIQAVGRGVDRSVIGQAHRFIGTPSSRVGKLGGLTGSTARSNLISCREKLNINNAPDDMRSVVLSAPAESAFLNTDLFVKTNESGTSEALRNARLGGLFGFDLYAANNTPSASVLAQDVATGTVTNAITVGSGPASQAVTLVGHNVTAGEYFTIAGNDQPQFATALTLSSGDTTAITPNEVNAYATSAGAALTVYKRCLVNNAGGYAVGHTKEVNVDGFTNPPLAGSMVSFGTGGSRRTYTVIESTANGGTRDLLLDRPLEVAVADNAACFPLPAGSYNLAFHKHALGLVTRPLAVPQNRLGVMAATASYNDLSMRIAMQYDGVNQGTRVTCDMLSGVALLDANLGVLFLG